MEMIHCTLNELHSLHGCIFCTSDMLFILNLSHLTLSTAQEDKAMFNMPELLLCRIKDTFEDNCGVFCFCYFEMAS